MRRVERDEVRRDEVHHDARAEHENLVPEIVAAEEFGACKLVGDIEADGQVGECGEARNGIRDACLDHEADEAERASRNLEEVRVERLRHAIEERGECGEDHRERDQFDSIDLEV